MRERRRRCDRQMLEREKDIARKRDKWRKRLREKKLKQKGACVFVRGGGDREKERKNENFDEKK